MSRSRSRGLLPAVAIAALAALVWGTHAAEPLSRGARDALVRLAGLHPPAPPAGLPDVAVVAIDPQSLRAYSEWPWPRSLYADLLERLDQAGARAVGFDIDFSTPRPETGDARFADALARSGRGVLAAFRQSQPTAEGVEIEVSSLPVPELARAAAALGSVQVPVEPDGVVRRFPRWTSIASERYPSLAGAALAVALGETPEPPPRDPARFRLVDYRRGRPAVSIFSVVDVLEGRVDPRDLAGRVVLVGATAAEFQDLWPTPLGPATPGVLIQAYAVRTLAAERAGAPVLRAVPGALELALWVALSLAAGRLGAARHARRLAGLALLGTGVGGAGAGLALAGGWLLDPVLPFSVLSAHYVLGLETVRRRFGRSLEEQEHSLSALFHVGQATLVAPSAPGGLDLALALLGDVVNAASVLFLRARPDGRLDGHRLEWTRVPGRPVGDFATAERVLRDGRIRSFTGEIPGAVRRAGAAIYVPLVSGETPVGVLVVERDRTEPLETAELRTVATVGAQLALSAQNLRLLEDLHATFDTSIAAIASAIEARDGYTELHCRRLAAFSAAMARRIGLPEEEVEAIRLGALLHDVGKIGIRDDVLMKPGLYTPSERREMERHVEIGQKIVGSVHGISLLTTQCVRHHHERWDGCGYPDALSGEQIPLGARLVTVVDVWDALSTERPYKKALPQGRVRTLLEKERGLRFDPDLLSLFLQVLDDDGEEMLWIIEQSSRGVA